MSVRLVSEKDFELEVLRSETPVLVDLFADWCSPCKQLEPVLAQLSVELEGKLKIVRVNIERSPIIARTFRVQSIPMLVLFSQGQPVDQLLGAVDKKTLLEFVRPVLGGSSLEIEPKELRELVLQQRAIPIDIREESAYRRYRIPGALNIPADKIADQQNRLRSKDGRFAVLYSRGEDEAKQLAEKLKEQGIEVGYLKGGFLNWEVEALEIERG
ncbi:MAG: thioredoxin fold domain-containing protein [Deltaproteobacteria bacterium]|nr:thioredoxin fold domain-containing protein [Deltaproteobacteria bacterium]